MNRFKLSRFAGLVLFVGMLISGCDPGGPTAVIDESEDVLGKKFRVQGHVSDDPGDPGDLIAGQHTMVGMVDVEIIDDIIYVEYMIDDPWCMTELHILLNNDEPHPSYEFAPGQFTIVDDNLGCITSKTVNTELTLGNFPDGLYIAAHAVVETAEVNGAALDYSSWPGVININVGAPLGSSSYVDLGISNWDALLDGAYPAWCIDVDLTITTGDHLARAYSSFDPNNPPQGLVENPGNLPLVNYILNQTYSAPYTIGDVQWAVWTLLDDGLTASALGSLGAYDATRGQAIIDDAQANIGDFELECGDVYGVIIMPVADENSFVPSQQPFIIPLPVPCDLTDETAWAYGYKGSSEEDIEAFKKKWGWYWPYP